MDEQTMQPKVSPSRCGRKGIWLASARACGVRGAVQARDGREDTTMKRVPEGLVTERTLRSMLRTIATELPKEVAVEAKLELVRHQERLAKQLRKVAIAKANREAMAPAP